MQRDRSTKEKASNAALTAEFDDVQARMDADALLAARLHEEERKQFSINEQARFLVEKNAERKRFFAAQRAEQIRNKPPIKTQLRNKMITFSEERWYVHLQSTKNNSFGRNPRSCMKRSRSGLMTLFLWILRWLKTVERRMMTVKSKQTVVRRDQEQNMMKRVSRMDDEQARFLVEKNAERKRFFAAQRAEQIRNKPPIKT
ncbi:hypothetical protein Tco_0966344 [Tanacetum coccineum]